MEESKTSEEDLHSIDEERQTLSQEYIALEAVRLLQRLSDQLLQCQDVTAALRAVLEAALSITQASMGNLQLFDPATGGLEIRVSEGFREDFLSAFSVVTEADDTACGRALRSRERVLIEDVQSDPLYAPYREIAAAAGYRSVQTTPLLCRQNRVIGLLSTHWIDPHVPSELELTVLDLYARHAADFVDRAVAAEQLRQSEGRYRLLVESAREYAILTLDLEGSITSWNAGAGFIFGYAEGEIVGRPFSDLFIEEDRAAGNPVAELERARHGVPVSNDGRYVRKDGSKFWASGTLEPLATRDGKLCGFAKVLRDNTERIRTEESLREAAQVLESKVHERTRQVVELSARLTMAEHQERDRLAQVLHDDLQQLLYGIKLTLILVEEAIESKNFEEATQHIEKSDGMVQRGIQLAQNLAVDLSPRVLENEGLHEMVIWLAEHMRERHSLQVIVKGETAVTAPKALRVLLFQAIRELLFNVVKHSGVKQATVEFRLPGTELLVSIADQGKGFGLEVADSRAGFGVSAIEQRLSLIGGRRAREPMSREVVLKN